jgi:nitroimidazol reductase NimA-like FMN-containing flavoprotein (pyridoxamine 5'-phosphate oxidase superfamily)
VGIQFTDDEERAFLAATHTGVVTTLRRDGWPVSLPVWFALVDDAIYLRTPARSKKVARVRNDDRACFLVEAGEAWAELRAVLWLGHLTEVDDEVMRQRAGAALGEKYAGFTTMRTDLPDATIRHYGRGDVLYELHADERRITWDNRKIRTR